MMASTRAIHEQTSPPKLCILTELPPHSNHEIALFAAVRACYRMGLCGNRFDTGGGNGWETTAKRAEVEKSVA